MIGAPSRFFPPSPASRRAAASVVWVLDFVYVLLRSVRGMAALVRLESLTYGNAVTRL